MNGDRLEYLLVGNGFFHYNEAIVTAICLRGFMLGRFWRPVFACICLLLAGCNLVNEAEITAEPTLDIPTVEILSPANNRQIVEGRDR